MEHLTVDISLTKRNYQAEARLEFNSYSNTLELNFENDTVCNYESSLDISEEKLKEFIVWAFKKHTKKKFEFTDLSFVYEYNCTNVHTINLEDCLEFWQLDETQISYHIFIMDAALKYVGHDFRDALSLIQGEYIVYETKSLVNEYLEDAIPDKSHRSGLMQFIDTDSLAEDLTIDYQTYEDYAIDWL